MAAVGGQSAQGGGTGRESAPIEFREAVEALTGARLRPEVRLSPQPAPRRLAPYTFALSASVEVDGEELADGTLVLLHDPDAPEPWNGDFRVVTMTRAELEPEMAGDPLLSEVGWSWLTDALQAHGARYAEPSGTVTRCHSQYFGALAERGASTEIELRASWTPADRRFERHLAAWADLLCVCAGLPPAALPVAESGGLGGVVPMPARRRPRNSH
ncbi:DUF3000 domain-containing protein [Kitasatospora cheerisanensis]|uniref:DUF3000 domain-containing protein n=1 Tax=Kitasatospora cheerisanensis KCTC 2395 TaxID=1348663 RepID=A0A066YMB8_9ACTN|nr:DUF3000 domain-containing protein [Kitasatospora cheerisanensis]KDN82628.1 hypothetical protein KCH_55430 [Kitasatospora cheerisanensis KCTC 2395]